MITAAHARVNESQIGSWLWIARHQIRKGRAASASAETNRCAARACEAMLSALWLMGIEQ